LPRFCAALLFWPENGLKLLNDLLALGFQFADVTLVIADLPVDGLYPAPGTSS
jgi:hypothetical protein